LSQTAFFIGYDFFAPGRQWFEPSSNLILSTLLFTIELNAPLTHHTHYTPKIILFITHITRNLRFLFDSSLKRKDLEINFLERICISI